MKKIITTLCVIFVAALGAQGQTTTNYLSPTGTTSFADLPYGTLPATADLDPYTKAQLLFRTVNLPAGVTVTVSGIVLKGQGISSVLNFDPITMTVNNTDTFTTFNNLNTSIFPTWDPSFSLVTFNATVNNGSLATNSSIRYRLTYSDAGPNQSTAGFEAATRTGTVILAVPEPSTYAAAAGLLALFLWSSRRHLFKLAGSLRASSDAGGSGAA